jgi:hypothetical protein
MNLDRFNKICFIFEIIRLIDLYLQKSIDTEKITRLNNKHSSEKDLNI